jgi:para-nitrobenzyl esterase
LITTGLATAAGVSGLGVAAVLAQRYGLIPPDHGGVFGATHGIDLPLMFRNLPVPLLDGHPAAEAVATSMSSCWLSFARTGDPTHDLLPDWPSYTIEHRATMLFNTVSTVVDDPDHEPGRVLVHRRLGTFAPGFFPV